jgi:hypothetical protein
MDPRLIRSRKTFCSIEGRRFAASKEDVLQHRRKAFCNIEGRRFATSGEGIWEVCHEDVLPVRKPSVLPEVRH